MEILISLYNTLLLQHCEFLFLGNINKYVLYHLHDPINYQFLPRRRLPMLASAVFPAKTVGMERIAP